MAIKKTIACPRTGLLLTDAYIKVGTIYDFEDEMRVEVDVYASEELKTEGKTKCVRFEESATGDDYTTNFADSVLIGDGKSLRSQAYVYLKTMDQYSGGTDV